MLAVSPLRSTKDENQEEMGRFSNDFGDLSDGNLLESINFDDLFAGINDGDVLPVLEMDPEIFAEFSVSAGEESEMNSSVETNKVEENVPKKLKEDEDKVSSVNSGMGSGSNAGSSQGEEIVSKRDESVVVNTSPKESEKGRKSSSSAQSKNNSQGKRKVKVIK